jgi:hypothetical protein
MLLEGMKLIAERSLERVARLAALLVIGERRESSKQVGASKDSQNGRHEKIASRELAFQIWPITEPCSEVTQPPIRRTNDGPADLIGVVDFHHLELIEKQDRRLDGV